MIIKDIPITNIVSGENIRQIPKESQLSSLMQTIKDNGLLQPIGVKEQEDGSYKILWGNRRLAACTKLGWKTIPAVIFVSKDETLSEEEFTIINGIENLQQSPNTLNEIGRICKFLRRTMSISEIAVKLGIPQKRVKNALEEIARIPVKWQRKIRAMETGNQSKEGFIAMTSALKVARLRGLSKDARDKLYEHLSKNDESVGKLELISSLVQSGRTVSDAIKEANNWEFASVNIYFNKEKLEKLLENYPSRIDMFVDVLNRVVPNLAVKKL